MKTIKKRNRKERMRLRQGRKFKSTNEIWNRLSLNQAWTIGYLTRLFKMKKFKTYSEWEKFYYESGRERLEEIEKLSEEKQLTLKNFKLDSHEDRDSIKFLSKKEKDLNENLGRTEKELEAIGNYMHEELVKKGNKMHISLDEAIDFVKIRVLDEIWMGVEREINTVEKLKSFYPNLCFKEVPVDFDAKYAVDCEVYNKDKLILAIQIKSDAYKYNKSKILKETKSYNLEKNRRYTSKYGADVLYVYSKVSGYIEDFSTIKAIANYVK